MPVKAVMTSEVAMQEERQKILIIDDTAANIQMLNEFLQGDYNIYFATNGPDGIRMARQALPDLILLDIMMPKMDGYEVCAKIKADPLTRQIPVIFITSMSNVEDEAKGLASGAIDYITKPVSAPIVKARVKIHLEVKRHRDNLEKLTIELDKKNQELILLARNDALTGLANRRYFDEILDLEIKRASRSGHLLSLILCDVDFFKSYNDHYGHVAGDKCLQAIGKVLRDNTKRVSDFPARYGGEEFVVIFPDTLPGNAGQLAEKLRQGMIAQAIPHAHSAAAEMVTLSFGVVEASPSRERNAAWYINAADKALYEAKENGRNQVVIVSLD